MPKAKPVIVQTHGLCDNESHHPAHVFKFAEYVTHTSLWDCPGQYSDCRNCDDRKCMACVLREWHDKCNNDCPGCCNEDA